MDAELATLLERSDWLRDLALELVGDEHAAEDLAQEARLAALKRPPASASGLSAWLAAIVRNLALSHRRARARRSWRELAAARPEGSTDETEMSARFEMQLELAQTVARLDEPYRTTVLLRYFEGLAPRQIAARTHTPVRTVHTRLARALAKLRAELGGERGFGAWSSVLVPAARGAGDTKLALGALLVQTKTKLVVAACLVLAFVGAAVFVATRPAPPVPSDPTHESLAAAAAEDAPPTSPSTTERAHVETEAEPASQQSPFDLVKVVTPDAPVRTPLRGRVFHVSGQALGGVAVRCASFLDDTVSEAISDGEGWFELDAPTDSFCVKCSDERFAPVLETIVFDDRGKGPCGIVVAERVRFRGVVVDGSGTPIADARVATKWSQGFRGRIDLGLEHSRDATDVVRTGADGTFALERVPRFEDSRVEVARDGCETISRSAADGDVLDWRVVLCEAAGPLVSVEGRVVDRGRNGIGGASVSLGRVAVTGDGEGRFSLSLPAKDDDGVLQAAAFGRLSARLERRDWPVPLEIVLSGTPLSISGTVVDSDGNAVDEASVSLEDPTLLGFQKKRFGTFEFGEPVLIEDVVGGRGFGVHVFDLGEEPAPPKGSFSIGGLLPRDYRLHVTHASSVTSFVTDPIRAGSRDVVVRLPAAGKRVSIAGRVVDRSGTPVRGIDVSVWREFVRESPTGAEPTVERAYGPTTRSGDGGTFSFDHAPNTLTHLQCSGSALQTSHVFDLREQADWSHLELSVALRCSVRITRPAEAKEADRVTFLDAGGTALHVILQHGDVAWERESLELDGERSESVQLSEDVRTLVFLRGETELARTPVELRPDRFNEVP